MKPKPAKTPRNISFLPMVENTPVRGRRTANGRASGGFFESTFSKFAPAVMPVRKGYPRMEQDEFFENLPIGWFTTEDVAHKFDRTRNWAGQRLHTEKKRGRIVSRTKGRMNWWRVK